MRLHYMLEGDRSVCGKPCKQLDEIPTDVDLQRGVMGTLTKCKPCLEWWRKPTSERTSVYLGQEIKQ